MPSQGDVRREWVDFVLWSFAPERVNSRAGRLAVENAVELAGADRESPAAFAEQARARGARITWAYLNRLEDDEFEAMSVGDFGSVTIWTTRRVWCIRREGSMEKLIFLPRHPTPAHPPR